ncbi:hypothetical protein P4S64_19770 [Vibrio sp. M60_M31a]
MRINPPFLVGASGEPVFLTLLAAVMSHTDSLCLAACAVKNDVPSIGIDVENNQNLAAHLLPAIYTANEQHHLQKSDTIPNVLIFSIKERVYSNVCFHS